MQQFVENILVAYGVPILSALGNEYFVAIPLAFVAHWWDWPGLESTLSYLAVAWIAHYAPSIRADRPHDPEAFASLVRASRPKTFYVAISLTLRGLDWLGLAKYTTFTACATAVSTTALAYAASRFIERRTGFSIWRSAVRGATGLWGRSVDARYRLFVGSMAAEVRLRDATQHLLDRFWPRAVTKLYMRLLGVDIDERWTYQPLADPNKHIRLFRLARWVPFAGVRGSVIHVPLGGSSSNSGGATSSPPEYTAISYHWGTVREKRWISVNGARFAVSLATHDALAALASPWRERLVWIDYLCINQGTDTDTDADTRKKTLEEKSAQVLLMRDIYGGAHRVIIHIPPQPLAPFAHQILHELLLFAANRADSFLWNPSLLHAKYELEVLGAPWQALVAFLNADWFSRMWVAQEVALASAAELHYAGHAYEWAALAHALQEAFRPPEMAALLQLTQRGRRAVEQLGKLSTLDQTRRLMPLVRIHRTMNTGFSFALSQALSRIRAAEGVVETEEERRRNEALRRDPAPLIHLLHRFAHFDATDPRDKIYALQGLLAQDCPPSLIPDYDAVTTPELFRRAAKHILSDRDMDERLALFAMTGFGSPGRDDALLPSWVPDLVHPPPAPPLAPYVWPRLPFEYDASAGHAPPPALFPHANEPDVLSLDVLRFDVLAAVGPPLDTPRDDDFARDANGRFFSANDLVYFPRWHASTLALAARHASDPYPFMPGGQTLCEAFWRTLVGDADKDARPAPAYLADVYADTVALWEEMLPYGLDEGRTMTLPDDEDYWARQRRAGVWCNAMAYCVTGRSLGATAAGYLGCVPRWARAGDEIVVVRGSKAPLVVRRAEADDGSGNKNGGGPGAGRPVRYRILGQCYVHGIMDGEAVGSDPAWQAMEFV